ncbi:hypothetical protein H0H92_005865 [Tricholoma furcatifolium]|nr:hypothetical protein H0H92_005865 [Tricholoma furcatifolium]
MPATRLSKSKQKLKLYNHAEAIQTTQALASSTSGHRIKTVLNQHLFPTGADPDASDLVDNPPGDEPLFNDVPDMDVQMDDGDDDIAIGPDEISGIKVKLAKRYANSDSPLLTWIGYRDEYLDAFLRLEGRNGTHGYNCDSCGQDEAIYRCLDCCGRRLVCFKCLKHIHVGWQPLHVIEVWQNDRFIKIAQSDLDGFDVQFGHRAGKSCIFPEPANKDFTVFHTNGIHNIKAYFCGCRINYSRHDQVLDMGWYPGTPLDPKTCATFEVLRQFQTLNLQGKLSAFNFYTSLNLMTDATGLTKKSDRLSSFLLIVREWRHLKAAKRAGRAHDPSGISGTPSEGWEKAPPELSWLYRLILSQDANFRLKNRLRSSEEKDPTLGPGFAYFLSSDEYLSHLSKYIAEDEISHCVGFAALWAANKKKSKGLRATGVASVSCSRHQLFRQTGTGDLQKGERYSNMDAVFLSSIATISNQSILLCYDIACQYCINFSKRHENMKTERLKLVKIPQIDFKVPKFHLPPHKSKCHGPFSLNYTPGAGRTDGEGVERNWAWLNGAVSSTSQMGPGARHDTLDDFMAFWNYQKTVDLGDSLLKNLVYAIPQAILHRNAFHAFTDGLKNEHLEKLMSWEKMLQEWEIDKSKPDPYFFEEDTVTASEIRRQLAEEDHRRVASGAVTLEYTASSFIISGLSLADDQLFLRSEARKKERTPAQEESLQQKRTTFLRKFRKYREAQVIFMPGLPSINDTDVQPELLPLRLPSSINAEERLRVCLDGEGLAMSQDRLCEGQASDALSSLRRQLRTQTFARKFRNQNANSQASYTRARTLEKQIASKIAAARDRYRFTRAALFDLRGPGKWEEIYRVLRDEDIRSINESIVVQEEQEADEMAEQLTNLEGLIRTAPTLRLQTGDGKQLMSWIWYGVTTSDVDGDTDTSLQEGLRLEWMKARARADRWREEVMLLEEEMRRALEYTRWKAKWWEEQGTRRPTNSEFLKEGLAAYASEQTAVELARYCQWDAKWCKVRQRAKDLLHNLQPASGEVKDHFDEIEVELEATIMEDNEDEWSD